MIHKSTFTAARHAAVATLIGISASLLASHVATAQQTQAPQQFGPRVNRQAQPQPPKPEVIATHGDWQVQCGEFMARAHQGSKEASNGSGSGKGDALEGQDSASGEATRKVRQCGIMQSVRSAERQNLGLTLVLVNTKQGDRDVTMMRILVPVGVFLPTGIALEIDGTAVGRVPFTRCLPQVCMAFAEATPETIEKMKQGSTANFIIYEAPGAGLSMEVSLSGFTAAYDQLNAL